MSLIRNWTKPEQNDGLGELDVSILHQTNANSYTLLQVPSLNQAPRLMCRYHQHAVYAKKNHLQYAYSQSFLNKKTRVEMNFKRADSHTETDYRLTFSPWEDVSFALGRKTFHFKFNL